MDHGLRMNVCLLEHIVNSYTRKFYCCSFTVSGEYLALINVLKLCYFPLTFLGIGLFSTGVKTLLAAMN